MAQYELNLRDCVRIINKRKFIILATFLVVTISSAIYLFMQPPVYESSTTVKILERQSIAGLLTEWIVYSPADLMESQTKIVEGFPIIKKVALRLGLINEDSPTSKIHSVVGSLQGKITTETISRTNIIRIIASAGIPREAMDLAGTVAQVYVEENLLEKRKQASTARNFIKEQLSQLEERLKDGEEQLRQFSDGEKDIRLAQPLQKKLVDLEFELATLLQKFTDKYPHVIAIKEQIQDIKAQLKNFSKQDLDYARLAREVEVNKKLYSMLKEKLEEARITEAQKVGDVSIVDPAVMPRYPVSPQRGIGAIMGGMTGLLLGICLAFLLETLDTSIGTIEDVENFVKLPVLGIVPSIPCSYERRTNIITRFKEKILPSQRSNSEEVFIRLIVHHKPTSSMAEAYRNIRTYLKISPTERVFLVTSAAPREGKTTILTNLGLAVAQKGTSVLLVSSDLRRPALAKTFGLKKEPGLHEVITGTVELEDAIRSISDIMLGEMELDEILKTPGIENLWILPSGHLPRNPAELLGSKELPGLIEQLKERFDVIFFDSPPILLISDTCLLASRVDSVILCYEIGRTAREVLLRAKTQLESVGANISGVVLNHIAPETETMGSYPYYYKYKYRYYQTKVKQEA